MHTSSKNLTLTKYKMESNIDNKHWTLKRQYIKAVYTHVIVMLCLFSAACATAHATQLSYKIAGRLSLLSFLGIILSVFNSRNIKIWTYFTTSMLGIGLHPLIGMCLHEGYHNEIYMALVGTIIIFATLTSIVVMSDSQKFLFLGGPLLSSLFILLIGSLVNMFILKSSLMHTIEIVSGLVIFSLYVVYDTSVILNRTKYQINDFNCIVDAMNIFLDIINIFIRILVMLIKNKNAKKKANN